MHKYTVKLLEARLLVEKGWIQGSTHTEDGYCTLWALNAIDPALFPIFKEANKIGNIMMWNDDRNRTKQEVMEAFDRAIEYSKTI